MPPTTESCPKLKACMAEIKQVMDRYDCGGFAVLSSKEHTEFELHLPEWSVASMAQAKEGDGRTAMHIKHRANNHAGTTSTLHLLLTVRDCCGLMAKQMNEIYEYCKDVLGIEHKNQASRGS